MKRRFAFLLCLLVALRGLAAADSAPPESAAEKASDANPSAGILTEFKVTPDAQGLGDFLRGLSPNDEAQNTIARAIAKLGDDEYAIREEAMKQLLRMPVVPVEPLKKASHGPDAEVRWRSQEILDQAGKRSDEILDGVLRTIAYKQVQGLTKEIIAAIPHCTEDHLVQSAAKALEATATRGDADLLRQALKNENLAIRAAAAGALGQALGEQGAAEMKALIAAPEERVRLAAARALAAWGDRAALEPLGKLLAAEDPQVRLGAIRVLRGLTGQKFAYVPYDEPAARKQQTEQWQEWIATPGARAELQHPLQEGNAELGRTLIVESRRNRVIEFGPDGKQTWEEHSVSQPVACQGLPNGHRLVISSSLCEVFEFDEQGNKVWEASTGGSRPTSVERLENGNTLCSCYNSQTIVEIDRHGKQVAEISTLGRPVDAHRLPNGSTLVALRDDRKVVELDGKGAEVWSLSEVNIPSSAQRLANGNTLIAEQGKSRVVEFDRSGKEVWSQEGFPGVYNAQRLENGNTIVACRHGIREIDHQGKLVWEKTGVTARHVHRF